ncbi:hypothetical protein BDW02DRAFT_527345 [Decorospora gaudefroyi]|uniref:Mediator of RNA polymerase II transcription subunit 16 n=1 Tax=Decorospora gaudefroyi TaxID=184978 RepID=A0A6A5KDT8_9PLEO|nr:hypothetical protein BDW02DRAFT_527345 [Decorospora gaudefroyi]
METSYNMDVDDLFGDSEHVSIPTINATLPVKGLDGRLDELGSSGCCQKITWSKNGCVACISSDGYTVNLKVFSRANETGKWHLGKDVPLELPQGRDVFPLVHVSWSHLGNDLAVIDEAGRVMVFSCHTALNRMQFVRAEITHPESEVDSVVGMHWLAILPYDHKNQIAWSAAREQDRWKWTIRPHLFKDAHHPVEGKTSFIYLKKYGELKLRFQQHDNSWQEASTHVGPMISTREPFTHAAFASNNDNTLLLVAYDVMRRLHLYRIETLWNADKRSQGPFEKPTIQVSLMALEDDCNPVDMGDDDLRNGTAAKGAAAAQLTHLNFLPTTPEQDDGSIPTVQAMFCRPPNPIPYDMNPQEARHSVIVKWGVHQQQQNQLHPSLDQVTSKKKSVNSVPVQTTFVLKRQPDFALHAVVLAFHPVWYSMLLVFCYSDGTIEFRKRSTMEIIMPDGNTDTVLSLMQAGFVFQHTEPSLHLAFSPNHCMAVCLQLDGTTKLRSMEYQHGTLSTDDDDPRHSAALAALTLQSSSAANQYFSSDDIFAITGPLTAKRRHDFTTLLFEGHQVNIDCGIDESCQNHFVLLGRAPIFVKTLSAMHILGQTGPVHRSLSSKMAWQILNVKYVTQILTTVMRAHGDINKQQIIPDMIPRFIGIVRWTMHYMAYILDDLFALGRNLSSTSTPLTRAVLEENLRESNRPALLLLLSAFPRSMLKLWSQPLNWVKRSTEAFAASTNSASTSAGGAHPPSQSPELRKVYMPLHAAVHCLPFEWRYFDVLVGEIQSLVRAIYAREKYTEAQRNACERDLLLGRIPDVLFPVAKRLVTDSLWNSTTTSSSTPTSVCLADKIDTGKLLFFDTTWLGFQESERAKIWNHQHVVDVCQKNVIRGLGVQGHPVASPRQLGEGGMGSNSLRQCVRCGECMEDVVQGLPGYSPNHVSWLIGVTKHCICGNGWMVVEGGRKKTG